MNQKKKVLILVLALVVLIGGAGVLYQKMGQKIGTEQLVAQEEKQPEPTAEEETKEQEKNPELVKAPDFVVYDFEGKEVRLSDYIGKPLVVNFWASWCGPCQMEMPDFQKKYEKMGEEIQFLMINMTDGSRETVEKASTFIGEQEYTFPVFYDTESNAAATYGEYSLPTTFFIDAEGYAVAQAKGAIDGETLQKGIDMITK